MAQRQTFRLMTYNILNGGIGREAAIIEVIQAAAPDLVITPEVMKPAVFERIATRLGMTPYLVRSRDLRKVGLLSRLPVIAAYSYRPWRLGRHCLEVSVQLLPAQSLTVYGLHLKSQYPLFEGWRSQEMLSLLRRIGRTAPGPHLLVGDFNTIAPDDWSRLNLALLKANPQLWSRLGQVWCRSLKPLLEADYIDCFRTLHSLDHGFTYPAFHPRFRLDYIFADPTLSPALRACRVVTEPKAVRFASDHLPVLAEFVWPNGDFNWNYSVEMTGK